jgi:hypothetical protein
MALTGLDQLSRMAAIQHPVQQDRGILQQSLREESEYQDGTTSHSTRPTNNETTSTALD